jgi:hypothetical protein
MKTSKETDAIRLTAAIEPVAGDDDGSDNKQVTGTATDGDNNSQNDEPDAEIEADVDAQDHSAVMDDDEVTMKSDDDEEEADDDDMDDDATPRKGADTPSPTTKLIKARISSSAKKGRSPSVAGLAIPFRTVKKA